MWTCLHVLLYRFPTLPLQPTLQLNTPSSPGFVQWSHRGRSRLTQTATPCVVSFSSSQRSGDGNPPRAATGGDQDHLIQVAFGSLFLQQITAFVFRYFQQEKTVVSIASFVTEPPPCATGLNTNNLLIFTTQKVDKYKIHPTPKDQSTNRRMQWAFSKRHK